MYKDNSVIDFPIKNLNMTDYVIETKDIMDLFVKP